MMYTCLENAENIFYILHDSVYPPPPKEKTVIVFYETNFIQK